MTALAPLWHSSPGRRLAGGLFAILLSASAARATTRYVSPAGVDAPECSNPAQACATINYAIGQASPGDAVSLAAGTYAEDVTVDRSLTIFGPAASLARVLPATVNPNPSGCSGSLCPGSTAVFRIQANNVAIHDLTVDGNNANLPPSGYLSNGINVDARDGIEEDYNAAGYPFSGLTIHHAVVQNIYARGIQANDDPAFDFHDNSVVNVDGDPAYSIAVFASHGSGVIHNNVVTLAADAISSNWSHGIQFLDNTITQSASGIHTDNSGGDGGNTPADVIRGNTVSNGVPADGAYGIFLFVPYVPPLVDGNNISNVNVGLAVFGGPFAPGILSSPPLLQNNLVVGPGPASSSVGVYLTTDTLGYGATDAEASVVSNGIVGWGTGIQIVETVDSGSGQQRYFSADASSNRIAGNGVGLDNSLSLSPRYTIENWWGCNYGPGAGGAGCVGTANDTTGSGITFDPWLTLGLSAEPASVAMGADSAVTARMTIDSNGNDTSAFGHVPDGTPVVYTASPLGGIWPISDGTASGVGYATFDAGQIGGGSQLTGTVDGQTLTTAVTVECTNPPVAPAISGPAIACAGSGLTLLAEPGDDDGYQWFLNGNPIPGAVASSCDIFSAGPGDAGSYTVVGTVGACSSAPSAPFTLSVAAITLSPAELPGGSVGIAYSQTITASGGTAPYTFSMSGALPPGLALTSTGVVSGTPTTAGSYTFAVMATDSQGCFGTHTYTLDVVALAVVSVSPNCGPASGATTVTITGSNFHAGASVKFLDVPATNVVVIDSGTIQADAPSSAPGAVGDVKVTNPDGNSATAVNAWGYDFLDVPSGNPFHTFVCDLVRNHITAGCGAGDYCPATSILRNQMAVFVTKAIHSASYTPPPATGTMFSDVPANAFGAAFIEEARREGVMGAGEDTICGAGLFCPSDAVTRLSMAYLLLRGEHGGSYTPPSANCATFPFVDVPCPSTDADFVAELVAEGITGGCDSTHYCPGNPVIRAQMAVFLTVTFSLP
jgi:hypothetical protein